MTAEQNWSRRKFILTTVLASAASAISTSLPAKIGQQAGASSTNDAPEHQTPGVYHFRVGSSLVTAILDGYIDILPEWWVNIGQDQLKTDLIKQFLNPTNPVRISVNTYLIRQQETGKIIAIDSGASSLFGPTAGNYGQNLALAGINPDDVDILLLTHMHPDHIGGMIAKDKQVFPNAQVYVDSREHNYWSSSTNKAQAPEFAKTWFDSVQVLNRLYDQKIHFFDSEKSVVQGFTPIKLYGHTPGHSGFLFESGGDQLFFWADTTDQTGLQLNNVNRRLVFDVNGNDAVTARKKAIDIAYSEKLLIAGSHVPFPSFGHIGKAVGSYYFLAADYQYEIK